VRGFDARTGKLLWTFHVVPRDGEFGAGTWGNGSGKLSGDIGSWCYLVKGKQYIVIPIGGREEPAEWVALALP
jgi:quinoprotein glucose dehydrogenase